MRRRQRTDEGKEADDAAPAPEYCSTNVYTVVPVTISPVNFVLPSQSCIHFLKLAVQLNNHGLLG